MSQFNSADLIRHTINKSPSEFKTAFDAMMSDRMFAALEAKKQQVAQSYFNNETQEVEAKSDEDTETTA